MDRIRFIHISDVLLGAEADCGNSWCEDRKNEIYHTFEKIIECADMESVDFIFVAGNLFDHQPSVPELDWLDNLLRRLKHTVVVYAAGDKDHLGDDAPLLSYKWTAPVCVIGSSFINSGEILPGINVERDDKATMAVDHLCFPESNIAVYGVSYYGGKMTMGVIDDVVPDRGNGCNILVACGGDRNKLPIDWNRIRNSRFDYVALGGRQKYYPAVADKAYYPGSPEAVSSESVGAHGYIYGDIREDGVHVEFRKTAVREYKRIDYPVDNHIGDVELGRALQRLLDAEGKNNIYTINIVRGHGCEKDFDISDMLSEYRIIYIQNEKFMRTDYSEYIKANRNNNFGVLLEAMNSAEVDDREGVKLAVDSMIEISRLYTKSNKRMTREQFRTARGQVLEMLSARCDVYENDDAVREYERIRGDYEISPDVLEELNQVWAQERKCELEITTLRHRLDELPRQYRRCWIQTGVRMALVPLMILGILSIVILYMLAGQGNNMIALERIIYAVLLNLGIVGLTYYIGYGLSKYRGIKRKNGKKNLSTELEECMKELETLCAWRDDIHKHRINLQMLDGRRREIYEKLTVSEKLINKKLQDIRAMRCAIDVLNRL